MSFVRRSPEPRFRIRVKDEGDDLMRNLILAVASAMMIAACASNQAAAPTGAAASRGLAPTDSALETPAPVASLSSASPLPSTESPTFAADEPWIVYQLFDGHLNLRLIRPDGTGGRPLLTDPPGDQTHPDWSPDGSRIAYVIDNDMWIVNVDGSAASRVFDCADPCVFADYPAWSPDGTSVMFVSADAVGDTAPSSLIQAVNIDSGKLTSMYETVGPVYASYPRWAPDGRSIVTGLQRFATTKVTDCSPIATALGVIDLGAGTPEPIMLTDGSMFADYPDWSPDGSTIVFTTYDLGTRDAGCFADTTPPSDLYTVMPDGTQLTQLTHNPSGISLVRNGTASGPLSTQPSWTLWTGRPNDCVPPSRAGRADPVGSIGPARPRATRRHGEPSRCTGSDPRPRGHGGP